jgi:hypothetical protein
VVTEFSWAAFAATGPCQHIDALWLCIGSSFFLAFKLLASFPFCGTNLTSHSNAVGRSASLRISNRAVFGWGEAVRFFF